MKLLLKQRNGLAHSFDEIPVHFAIRKCTKIRYRSYSLLGTSLDYQRIAPSQIDLLFFIFMNR